MNPVETTPRPTERVRVFLRDRWRLVAGVAVALLVMVAWLLLRGGGDDTPAHAEEEDHGSETDSIVHLDSTAQRLAGIELVTVAATTGGELTANGTITYDANRVSFIAPRVAGRAVSVRADLGQLVRAGEVLATLESPDVGEIRADLDRATSSLEVAQRNYDREKRLYDQQITSEKELLGAEAELNTARADLNSAAAKLRALGAGPGDGGMYGLTTSLSGTVVERNASPGQSVDPATPLFTVADLSHVWITIDVYEGDLTRVSQGAPALVTPTALPGTSFPGRVTYAGGIVDPGTHTFKVRVTVENSSRRLRPGMFAQVRIQTPVTTTTPGSITVPEVAVQELNGRQVVFVALPQPGAYAARTVVPGTRSGNGAVTINSGLVPGERVVARGAFQLKAELLKSTFGDAH